MSISAKIGCPAHTLNQRVKKADADSGRRAGIPADVAARLKVLERENRELRQAEGDQETLRGTVSPANEVLRKAARRSAARTGGAADRLCDGGARPPTETMIAFIDAHRGQHGAQPSRRRRSGPDG